MEGLDLFFEALKSGDGAKVDLVRDYLEKKERRIMDLQKETMLSQDTCKKRLAELDRLSRMCEKIERLERELEKKNLPDGDGRDTPGSTQ